MKKLSMDELARIDAPEFAEKEKNTIILVLDDIRSMNNVGASFRTADAFAIEKIILCGITATPPHREIEKTALGATQTVVWEHYENGYKAIEKLKNEGYLIVIVEQTDESILLHDFDFQQHQKYVFIVGNEVTGVQDMFLDLADFAIEIPQFGTKHSLNVAVATGIVLWQCLDKVFLAKKQSF